MKNYSSNKDMEQIFQKLASIQKVEPDSDLFYSISKRIRRRDVISLSWLKIAAAVLLILFSFEFLLLKKDFEKSASNELKELVPQTNNLIYHE
jgi:hypothetical protein